MFSKLFFDVFISKYKSPSMTVKNNKNGKGQVVFCQHIKKYNYHMNERKNEEKKTLNYICFYSLILKKKNPVYGRH